MIPIMIVMTVFAYLGWRKYLAHQERMAALQQGIDPATVAVDEGEKPEEKAPRAPRVPKDHRLSSMILIAVGAAYMVAIFFSVGAHRGVERAIAAAVWGIIPLTIGVTRYAYHSSLREGEQPEPYRRSAFVLMSVGIAYIVSITLSVGVIRGAERATIAGVWGIIPFAIGVAMFIYSGMVRREREAQGLRRGEEGE
jgi:cadmium resistance protein CadD (predicted permease)